MIVKVSTKRQITLPVQVLEALEANPGDQLEVKESPDGYVLRPKGRIDYFTLVPLRDKIPPGHPPFAIQENSARKSVPPRYGTETSILVRLLTGQPSEEFERCARELSAPTENDGAAVFASNQAIGEAYIAVQHYYGGTEADVRAGLFRILASGLVSPLSGNSVLEALTSSGGLGLFDRLIADSYNRVGLEVLTVDRRMSRLRNTRRL